ncbi:MAG: serine/threonine protein kinase [Myxococcales bacterium]|nr:serine/threonine protein kinase [Myxococcales bacterium]
MERTSTTLAEESVGLGLAATAQSGERPAVDVERPPGATLGRYVLLDRLGAGAMGEVYSAHDRELDRQVAIKFLQPGLASEGLRVRLRREAQAMARLSHPNVVTVHDVGEEEGQIFVAMEYVRGVTLRAWLGAQARSWQEILEVFVPIGRGLAAAHAAGIVHRDFKPDNVMVGEDGRPRVMDFGLARADEGDVGAALRGSSSGSSPSGSALTMSLTQAGAILGTPVYMAPELWSGAIADARCDLFAYCVALWEALWGERPFAGASLPALIRSVSGGALVAPKGASRVPTRVRRAIERGLARQPETRWASMDALVAELERALRRPVRRATFGAVAVLSVAVVGLATPRALEVQEARAKEAACDAKADAIFPDPDHWSLVRALANLPTDTEPRGIHRLLTAISRHQAGIREAKWRCQTICLDPPEQALAWPWLEARIDRCFDRVAHDLEIWERWIASADPVALYDLVPPGAAECVDFGGAFHAMNAAPEDPAARERWRALRARLVDARVAMVDAPRATFEAELDSIDEAARRLDDRFLMRWTEHLRARHFFLIGSPRRAHEALARSLEGDDGQGSVTSPVDPKALALHAFEGGAAEEVSLKLAARLFEPRIGPSPEEYRDSLGALIWWPEGPKAELIWGDGGVERPLDGLPSFLDAGATTRLEGDARLLVLAGDYDLAASHARKALEIAAGRGFAWPAERSSLLLSLGRAELGLGRLREAATALAEALAMSDPEHTSAARRGAVLLASAELAAAQGDLEGAERRLAEASALAGEAAGEDALYGSLVELVAGRLALRRGENEEAKARLLHARRGLVTSAGFARGRLAEVHAELAALAIAEGRLDDADEALDEALTIRRSLMGDEHIAAAPLLALKAEVAGLRGALEASAELGSRAAALEGARAAQIRAREDACPRFAPAFVGLRPGDDTGRAEARELYLACRDAGVGGSDFSWIRGRVSVE